jgi:hypothetical protein
MRLGRVPSVILTVLVFYVGWPDSGRIVGDYPEVEIRAGLPVPDPDERLSKARFAEEIAAVVRRIEEATGHLRSEEEVA